MIARRGRRPPKSTAVNNASPARANHINFNMQPPACCRAGLPLLLFVSTCCLAATVNATAAVQTSTIVEQSPSFGEQCLATSDRRSGIPVRADAADQRHSLTHSACLTCISKPLARRWLLLFFLRAAAKTNCQLAVKPSSQPLATLATFDVRQEARLANFVFVRCALATRPLLLIRASRQESCRAQRYVAGN